MHTAFLLAAGFGTRLRPLTEHRPKPLMPMCGVPMLDYTRALLRSHGHERILVNAHHLWEQVAAWCERHNMGLQVKLPDILGTGGGLKAASDRLAERFVIVNADILCDIHLSELVDAVPADGAAMALRAAPDWEQIGPVLADETGIVRRITSLVPGKGQPGTHFTGVHAMHRGALERIPDGFQCVVRTAYIELVPEGLVRATKHPGTWVDVGTPEAYLRANLRSVGRAGAGSARPLGFWRPGCGRCFRGEGRSNRRFCAPLGGRRGSGNSNRCDPVGLCGLGRC